MHVAKSTGKLVAPQCCGSDMMDDRCGSRCVRMCYVCQGCMYEGVSGCARRVPGAGHDHTNTGDKMREGCDKIVATTTGTGTGTTTRLVPIQT